MSLGLSRVGSAVKLPEPPPPPPNWFSREHLHVGLILWFMSDDGLIHAERKYTWKQPWTYVFPPQIGKPCKQMIAVFMR